MDRVSKIFNLAIYLILILFFTISCQTTPDTTTSIKETESKNNGINKGKLITKDGLKFSYRYYSSDVRGASVIYVPCTAGLMTYERAALGSYALAEPLNKNGFNFFTFNRADVSFNARGFDDHYKNLTYRAKTGYTYFLTKDGKESAALNIVRNEITKAIEYVENSPSHDSEKGIYLIGGSYGSWLAMVAVNSFPLKIKGVVFLSPAILREWMTTDQEKYPQLNITEYWNTLLEAFGKNRPALAIGGAEEEIRGAQYWPTWPALDGAKFLQEAIGPNVEVYDTSFSKLHATELLGHEPEVTDKIVQWITDVNNR